ncbi:MAG: hypothetical protein FJX76_28540 [Armatimonadetes bacterium]|nr:hypothetical protein [Armatimonadota bacterium]
MEASEEAASPTVAGETGREPDSYRWLMWALLVILVVQVGWLLTARGKKKTPVVAASAAASGNNGKAPGPAASRNVRTPAVAARPSATPRPASPPQIAATPPSATPPAPPSGNMTQGESPSAPPGPPSSAVPPSPPPAPAAGKAPPSPPAPAAGKAPPPPGTPAGKAPPPPPRPPAPRSLPQIVAGLLLMDSTPAALSPTQRRQVLDLARRYEQSARRLGDAATQLLHVLTEDQRDVLVQPHPPPQIDASEFAPGRDPLLEALIAGLEKKAVATAPTPTASRRSAAVSRWMVLTGLSYLETQGPALSPLQARQALASLRIMQRELKNEADLEARINGLLNATQQKWLMEQPLYEEAVVPGLMVRWLEKK